MADASAMKKAKDIVFADDARKYVVVSAPGKRFKGDVKITDVLYNRVQWNAILVCAGGVHKLFSNYP